MTDEASEKAGGPGRFAIGIDVGGSGIKAAVVDVDSGRLTSERLRVPTPVPSTPEAIIASIARLVRRLVKSGGLDDSIPVGVGLPGVTIDGMLKFAGNIDQTWIDFPVVERLTKVLKRRVYIINDADAAGIAEMRIRYRQGQAGKGRLPDARDRRRVGRVQRRRPLREHRVRSDGDPRPCRPNDGPRLSRASSAGCHGRRGPIDLDEHLDRIQQLMWPNLMILGGGVSKSADRFIPRLTVKCEVVAAELRNDAGIIGAAIVAAESRVEDAEGVSIALEPARSTREAKT